METVTSREINRSTNSFEKYVGQKRSEDGTHFGTEDLILYTEELQRNLHRILAENHSFYKYLENTEPESLENMSNYLKSAKAVVRKTSTSSGGGGSLGRETRGNKIAINQKIELVTRAKEEMEEKVEAIRKKLKKFKFVLTAQTEDIETRLDEIGRATHDFESRHSNDNSFDKFVYSMNEWSRKANVITDKCRLRYSSLKTQARKLAATVAEKQLIGENLQEIDVENLRLENMRLIEKIEKQTHLLLEMKQMTGRGNLHLCRQKQLVQQKDVETRTLRDALKIVEEDIRRWDNILMAEYENVKTTKEKYEKLKKLVDTYHAPSIIDYMKQKTQVVNLKKELKMWQRRKALKETSLGLAIEAMKKALNCKEVHSCWFN